MVSERDVNRVMVNPTWVLILVLVEDGLRDYSILQWNPLSDRIVLILVLVEDGLRG